MSMTMPSNAPVAPVPPDNHQFYQRSYLPDFSSGPRGSFPGYFIQSEEDIVPKYIPMDGSISFFPYKNLSKIVIKQWDSNGLNTLRYVIESAPNQQQPAQNDNANAMLPLKPEAAQAPNPIVEALQNINNGLANTFGQIENTMQAMQQEISRMNVAIGSITNGDSGGRG